jgi:hypothetical protein
MTQKQSLIKSRQRVRDSGEVFTPPHIVEQMCDRVSDETWQNPGHIFLEPTCGTGNFLVHMLQKRLDNGVALFDALNTLWGMDICDSNISECHKRLYKIIVTHLEGNGLKRGTEGFLEAFVISSVIIRNNIFTVPCALEEVKTRRFEQRKFVYEDPTGQTGVLSSTEKKMAVKKVLNVLSANNTFNVNNLRNQIQCLEITNKV